MTEHDALARLAAAEELLVAVDFDGTLSPLENEPMTARMLPAARVSVNALLALPRTTVAFVSGRSLSDLRVIAEHDDESLILLAGSHGAETWVPGSGTEPHPEDPSDIVLRDILQMKAEQATAGMDGVWIEPKTFGLGVHTRRADDATEAAAQEVVDAILARDAPGWRRRTGHNILEYSFRHEGKDVAVAHLRATTYATAVLFAGDDVTDEDALASLSEGDVGVHVGTPPTAASVCVPDISAFAAFLGALAQMRASRQE